MRRGQAALEFLATYGWAMLVILVSMGALYSMGFLDVEAYIPDSCLLDQGFSCDNYGIQDGVVTMRLQNNQGKPMTVENVKFKIHDDTCAYSGEPIFLDIGEQAQLEPTDRCLVLSKGGKANIDVAFDYSFLDSPYAKTATGTIKASP